MKSLSFSVSALLLGMLVPGCGDGGPSYRAEITRTTYGVPHIVADDFGSLGYGYGYAYAQDNYCVLMREIVVARGESARYFGEEGDLAVDFVWRHYNTDDAAREGFFEPLPDYAQDAITGFAAGMNRYLDEVGPSGLAEGEEGCRDAAWVRPIDALDLTKVYRKLALRAGIGALAPQITAAEPLAASFARASEAPASFPPEASFTPEDLGLPPPHEMGSNAYALGRDVTRSGRGMLLGNPHFPWAGPERFYMAHLTVTGEYDAAGASLHGVPVINIGFNENVAWSHTVSTARRFTLYELALDPDDPLTYLYDGEPRRIEAIPVEAEVLVDGRVETRSETIYMSHLGPIVELGDINGLVGGWPTSTGAAIALRDANLENTRLVEQWLRLGQAESLDDVEDALALVGIPWVNTIAVDRDGNAYYGDVGAVPHVTQDKIDECATTPIAALLTALSLPSLDGSRSECEWGSDEGSPAGVFGYENLPHLRTTSYAANANDTYWLANPEMPLEGFSPILGPERYEQSLRTRQTFAQAEARIAGTDGRGEGGFTIPLLQELMFSGESQAAILGLEAVRSVCATTDDWSEAGPNGTRYDAGCAVLDAWDGRFLVTSEGAHLFREVWERFDLAGRDWDVPFDADDPVNTPRDLNPESEGFGDRMREAIAAAVDRLDGAGIALGAAYGDVQFREDGDERIPIHGMPNGLGFSVISSSISGDAYRRIRHGNSYMQTVTWDETECPEAFALLSYSQSTDPASPHYADQTRAYSASTWPAFPFCASAIAEATISSTTIEN